MTIKKSLGSLTFEESQYAYKHHKSKPSHFVEMLHDLFVSVLSLRKDSLLFFSRLLTG